LRTCIADAEKLGGVENPKKVPGATAR